MPVLPNLQPLSELRVAQEAVMGLWGVCRTLGSAQSGAQDAGHPHPVHHCIRSFLPKRLGGGLHGTHPSLVTCPTPLSSPIRVTQVPSRSPQQPEPSTVSQTSGFHCCIPLLEHVISKAIPKPVAVMVQVKRLRSL